MPIEDNYDCKEIKINDFDVLAVPCSKAFVVAPEKVEEFKKERQNFEARKKVEEMAEKVRINNLVNDEVVLKRSKTRSCGMQR